MKDLFKDRTAGAYLSLGAAGLGLVVSVIYLIYSTAVGLFAPAVLVLMLAGVAVGAAAFALREETLPLVAAACYAFSFAMHLEDRALMFGHMATQVYGMSERGAILGVVILILVLQFVSAAAAVQSCFMKQKA